MRAAVLGVAILIVILPSWGLASGSLGSSPTVLGPSGHVRSEIASASFNVGSNSITFADYSMYNGKFLSEAAKRDLLGSVPAGGLSLCSSAEAGGGGLVRDRVGFTVRVRAGESLTLPKDVLDLVLLGNETGRTYDLEGAEGEALAVGELGISCSKGLTWLGRDITLGGAVKMLKGLAYGGIVQADGSLHSGDRLIDGDGRIALRTARGGIGYAIDMGVAHKTHSDMVISIYITDLASLVRWNSGCREEINTFLFDNVSLGTEDPDSLIKTDNLSREIPGFTSHLAPRLDLAVATCWHGYDLAATYRQALRSGALASDKPAFSVAGARDLTSWAALGCSVGWDGMTGMTEGLSVSLGKRTRFELGASVSPSPLRSSLKGLSLDLSLYRVL